MKGIVEQRAEHWEGILQKVEIQSVRLQKSLALAKALSTRMLALALKK